jgi:hypothetical protein
MPVRWQIDRGYTIAAGETQWWYWQFFTDHAPGTGPNQGPILFAALPKGPSQGGNNTARAGQIVGTAHRGVEGEPGAGIGGPIAGPEQTVHVIEVPEELEAVEDAGELHSKLQSLLKGELYPVRHMQDPA